MKKSDIWRILVPENVQKCKVCQVVRARPDLTLGQCKVHFRVFKSYIPYIFDFTSAKYLEKQFDAGGTKKVSKTVHCNRTEFEETTF